MASSVHLVSYGRARLARAHRKRRSQYPDRVQSVLAGADGGLQVRVVEGDGWSFDSRVRADGGPQAPVREAGDVATGLLDAWQAVGDRSGVATVHGFGTRPRPWVATDVYGLGAIVYWLATGRPPFEGSTDEIRRAVLTSSPIPPSDVRPTLPDGIDDVIEKAMATEKITRYESARQLLADLRRIA